MISHYYRALDPTAEPDDDTRDCDETAGTVIVQIEGLGAFRVPVAEVEDFLRRKTKC